MKYCKFCGKELSKEIGFCPYCMSVLERKKRIESKPIKKTVNIQKVFLYIMAVFLILISVIYLLYMFRIFMDGFMEGFTNGYNAFINCVKLSL